MSTDTSDTTRGNTDDSGGDYYAIPSLLTNSAMEVLEHFQEDIVEIRAAASVDMTNKDQLLDDHGLIRKTTTTQKVALNYQRIVDSTGEIQNPMNEANIERIKRRLRSKLDDPAVGAEPDLAVSSFTVDIVCPEITEATRSRSDEYEVKFTSDPVEDDTFRWRTQNTNADKNLYTDLSFQFRNLNLRSVVETRAKYSEQTNGKVWSWGGLDDTEPNAETKVSQAVKNTALPEDIADMKQYVVGADSRMKPVGVVADEQEEDDD
jgi:hypothetical protein